MPTTVWEKRKSRHLLRTLEGSQVGSWGKVGELTFRLQTGAHSTLGLRAGGGHRCAKLSDAGREVYLGPWRETVTADTEATMEGYSRA